MWFHLELRGKGYKAARAGLAISDKVTGPYTFAPRDIAGLVHRRTVDWYRILTRSAVPRPAALQDVRPLFSVTWNPK